MGTTRSGGVKSISQWVCQHHETLMYAYYKASENLCNAAGRNKSLYDRTACENSLLPGKRVVVCDNWMQGKGKLCSRWELRHYVISGHHRPDLPICKVRPEGRSDPECVLHYNLLHPCPYYPVTSEGVRAIQQATCCSHYYLKYQQRTCTF